MEHDKDQSGSVTKDELLPMMKASVSGVKGMDPSLVNEDDVDELWEMSDTDGMGPSRRPSCFSASRPGVTA